MQVPYQFKDTTKLRTMPDTEVVKQIGAYCWKSSWKSHEINQAFDEYHKLGHKQPSDRNCGSCISSVMKFWVHYIKDNEANG